MSQPADKSPPRTHLLKCWPEPYQAVLDGKKRHEFRRNDRNFAVGDILVLQEWVPPAKLEEMLDGVTGYTGRWLEVTVTYITGDELFGVPEGFVVLSIEKKS